MTPPTNATVNAALTAGGRGWHVFPLAPGSKRPVFKAWETHATTDLDRIRRYWTAHPRHGIGLACGPSGLLVIDLDQPKPGKDTPPPQWQQVGVTDGLDVLAAVCEQAGESLPPTTYTVATPSGGRHLYYTQPTGQTLRSTVDRLGWLIDTRGHGGYVAAPGTTAGHRAYTVVHDSSTAELPSWLAERLHSLDQPRRPQESASVELNTSHLDRFLARAIERSVAKVVNSAPRQHNKTLFGGAASLGELVAGGALNADEVIAALLQAGLAVGQSEREALATIHSGLKYGAKRPRQVAA